MSPLQFHFALFCLFLLNIPLIAHKDPKVPPLVLKLVHQNSMEFMSYKANKSLIDFPDQNTCELMPTEDSYGSPLIADEHDKGFFAVLMFDANQEPRSVYMDTGSSLLWMTCEPCLLTINKRHPYNPLKSSTYKPVHCEDDLCHQSQIDGVTMACNDKLGRCSYFINYGGSSRYSSGHLARESMEFGNGRVVLENILFGCSSHNNLFDGDGILGLGGNPILSPFSLISQMQATDFSYCFGNISDRSYMYSTLIIGGTNLFTTQDTRLMIDKHYYINLESITIGGERLDIDPKILRRNPRDYTAGMLIDSGSTFTFLTRVAADKFRDAVINEIENKDDFLEQNRTINYGRYDYTMLCYNGVFRRDLVGFPEVELGFEGGAVMELTTEHIFQQRTDKTFCFAIIPTEKAYPSSGHLNILGNMMQQYYYMWYDLEEETLGFKKMDCKTVGIKDENWV